MTKSLAPLEHTAAGLEAGWSRLGEAGGWLSGPERIAVAREARAARDCALCAERKAALSPGAVQGSHATRSTGSPSAWIEATHRIATDPGRLTERWYRERVAEGLQPEELVELTSVVAIVTIADTLSRALSLPERALPHALEGEPPRRAVSGTTLDRGWVPMVDPESAEGFVKIMYEQVEEAAGFVFNVARALTSVPEALRDFFSVFLPNYSTHGPVRPGGLERSQVELLASTTSAYNDCFY